MGRGAGARSGAVARAAGTALAARRSRRAYLANLPERAKVRAGFDCDRCARAGEGQG